MADTAALENSKRIRTLRRSPAAHLHEAFAAGSAAGPVGLRELPFLAMAGIRVKPDSDAGQRISALTGGLPSACGDVRASGDTAVLWLGPAEFLAVGPAEDHDLPGGLVGELLAALGGGEGQVVDLSANRTTFELSGPRALAVLQKGCSLDLHPRSFKTGSALSTEIGNIPAVLWKTGEENYRIFPRASFADFLGRWLLDGMREYASPEVP